MSEDVAELAGGLADRLGWRTDECPAGRAMEVVGTRSAILILREAFFGTTRFDDFAERVDITAAAASTRLRELVEAGLLERTPYQEPGQRVRHEYRLTAMGRDLSPVVFGLYKWGSKYLYPDGQPPVEMSHTGCGDQLRIRVTCTAGHPVPLGEVTISPTPKRRQRAPAAAPTERAAAD